MSNQRIRLLDILRGFAILGTLGTNIWIFAHLGDVNYIFTFENNEWWSSFQDFVRIFVLFLVNGKLLGLLTIMFGIGLELKYRQALRKEKLWPGIYIWTSIFLILEGLIHFTLVMEYDILMSYGVTAIIVSFIVKGGDRIISLTMKIIGGIYGTIALFILAIGIYGYFVGANFTIGDMDEVVLLYQDGSWVDQVRYRLSNFVVLRSEAIFVIPMNIFLFLLGIRLMRSGVFTDDENGRRKRKKLLIYGLSFGLPFNLLIFIPGGVFDFPIRYLFAPVLSIGYIGLIAKLVERNREFWLWGKLENAGKMSLSCYILQNVISSILFYGWGFGLGGKVDSVTIVFIWLSISLFQLWFASYWLKRFPYGPMESVRKYLLSFVDR